MIVKKNNRARAAAKSRAHRQETTRIKNKGKIKVCKPSPVEEYVEPINLKDPGLALRELLECAYETDRESWLDEEIQNWIGWSGRPYDQTRLALFNWLRYFSLRDNTYSYLKKLFPLEVA